MTINSNCCWPFRLCCYSTHATPSSTSSDTQSSDDQIAHTAPQPDSRESAANDRADEASQPIPTNLSRQILSARSDSADRNARKISISIPRSRSPERFDAQYFSPTYFQRSPLPLSALQQQELSMLPGQTPELEETTEQTRQELMRFLKQDPQNGYIQITYLTDNIIKADFRDDAKRPSVYFNTLTKQIVSKPDDMSEEKVEA